MLSDTIKLGKRGTVVIPVGLRKRYGYTKAPNLLLNPFLMEFYCDRW